MNVNIYNFLPMSVKIGARVQYIERREGIRAYLARRQKLFLSDYFL